MALSRIPQPPQNQLTAKLAIPSPQGELRNWTPGLRDSVTYWLMDNWYGDDIAGRQKAERLVNAADVTKIGDFLTADDIVRAAESGNVQALGAGVAGAVLGNKLGKALFKRADPNALGTFGGPLAAGYPGAGAEREAQKLWDLDTELGDRAAWDGFGLFQGKDNKWRFEIDDSQMRFTPDNPEVVRKTKNNESITLGDIIDHPSLFKNYPDLKDLKFMVYGGDPGTGAYWHPAMPEKGIPEHIAYNVQGNPTGSSKAAKSSIIHEIQHAIQAREGFSGGTNTYGDIKPGSVAEKLLDAKRQQATRTFEDPKDLAATFGVDENTAKELLPKYNRMAEKNRLGGIPKTMDEMLRKEAQQEAYHRAAGEVEPRTVQARLNKKSMYPWMDEDVPRHMQIVNKPMKQSVSQQIREASGFWSPRHVKEATKWFEE